MRVLWCLLLAGFVVLVVLLVAGVNWLNYSEQLPTQTSPDGEWKIDVRGRRLWTGSVEVTVRMTSPEGRSGGGSVKGVASSFQEFRKLYGNLQFRGDQAYAGGELFVTRPSSRS